MMSYQRLAAYPARPELLLLRASGGCDFAPERLLAVFGEQRRRFVEALRGFGRADWAAPTRCAEWSAHQVVRHLCDANERGLAAGPDDRTLDGAAGFDPRTTPGEWLAGSASEPPGATLDRFVATTGQLLTLAQARLSEGRRFDVRVPYGRVDWTVLLLHAFWDSWIHERDVLLPRGADHPTDDDATAYATAYGVFISTAVAGMFGGHVKGTLTLSGGGGGIFDLDNLSGVTVRVQRVSVAGPAATQVADALAGRAPMAAALAGLSASSRAALSAMADLFRTPVESAK